MGTVAACKNSKKASYSLSVPSRHRCRAFDISTSRSISIAHELRQRRIVSRKSVSHCVVALLLGLRCNIFNPPSVETQGVSRHDIVFSCPNLFPRKVLPPVITLSFFDSASLTFFFFCKGLMSDSIPETDSQNRVLSPCPLLVPRLVPTLENFSL